VSDQRQSNKITSAANAAPCGLPEEREHQRRVFSQDAKAEAAQKNNALRRARNALQRELAGRTDGISRLTQERERAEEELSQAQARIESVLANVADTHIAFDREWHYVYVNDAAARAMGRPREQILGRTLWELYPDIVGTELDRQYHRAMDERVPVAFDFHYELRDTWWANRFYPTPEGLAVFATDITERTRAEQALRRAHDELDQRVIERTRELSAINKEMSKEIAERKRAEEALRASQEQFQAIWNNSPTIMFIKDRQGRYLDHSPVLANPKCLSREQFLGKTDAEIFPPEQAAAFRANDRKVFEENRPMEFEETAEHEHGTHTNIVHKFPLRDAQGQPYAIFGIVIDITELKRAEAALRRSEANLAEGQRISHTGSWSMNPSTGDLYCSQELLRIFGLEAGGAMPAHETFLQHIHPEDRERVRLVFEHAVDTNIDYEAEYRIVRADGAIKHIHSIGHPLLSESGEVNEYVGTIMDITERKRAEEESRKLALLVENSTDFIGIATLDGQVLFLNRAGQDMVGLDGDEQARASRMRDYIAEKDWENLQQRILPTVIREGRWDGEARLRHFKTGAMIPTLQHIFLITDPSTGQRIALATIIRDITARKRAEEELRKAQTQLAHAMRVTMMGELAASIAHEINGPLGSIVNNGNACLRLIGAGAEAQDEAREALADIVADAERASAIIARIRALVQRSQTERIPLQLTDVLGEALALARRELIEQRIIVCNEMPEDMSKVWGDRVQLQEVFHNLIINAVDAMSAVEDDRRLLIMRGRPDTLENSPAVLISVEDRGAGFRPEDSERLFEAFFTTKRHGMGMGLRISRSIVEAHGGRLWATSDKGHGATFHCVLPVQPRKSRV
jgi:PAS domain S-box-containing protein